MQAGPQTFKNVVMKTNMKTFGLNYIPEMDKDMKDYSLDKCNDLLIIGLDVAHPSALTPSEKYKLKTNHPEMNNKHPVSEIFCC